MFSWEWEWRPDVMLSLGLAGAIFVLGWWRLRQRGRGQLAAAWRLAAYLGGLGILLIALILLDPPADEFFYAHMIQHWLLVMLAPPLLLLANPFPFFLWGVPSTVRQAVGHLLCRSSAARRVLRALTRRDLIWLVFIFTFVGWHDPTAYSAALRNEWIHNVEHLTFFLTALLFWWPVIGAGPRLQDRFPGSARVIYVLSVVPFTMLLGIFITFAQHPIYPYYATLVRDGGMTILEDQRLGGVIMWVAGSMMFVIAAVLVMARFVLVKGNNPSPQERGENRI